MASASASASSLVGVNGCEYERHCEAQFRRRSVMSMRSSSVDFDMMQLSALHATAPD